MWLTHNIGAGVALSCQMQRPRFETWEDLHQIGKEVHLSDDGGLSAIVPFLSVIEGVRSPSPFDLRQVLQEELVFSSPKKQTTPQTKAGSVSC